LTTIAGVYRHTDRVVDPDVEQADDRCGRISAVGRTQMPAKGPKKRAAGPLDVTLSSLAARVTEKAPRAEGSIVLRVTDTGEEYTVEGTGRRAKVARSVGSRQPAVQVRGTSDVIRGVLAGEIEASRAFADGGIRVRGDLRYLEGVLKDLGLLQCE
jgi:SCP-2 sterol transfer family